MHDAVRDAVARHGRRRAIRRFATSGPRRPGNPPPAPPLRPGAVPSRDLRAGRPGPPAGARRDAAGAVPGFLHRRQDADGLVLVDQNVAHERVLYEQYLADAERNDVQASGSCSRRRSRSRGGGLVVEERSRSSGGWGSSSRRSATEPGSTACPPSRRTCLRASRRALIGEPRDAQCRGGGHGAEAKGRYLGGVPGGHQGELPLTGRGAGSPRGLFATENPRRPHGRPISSGCPRGDRGRSGVVDASGMPV